MAASLVDFVEILFVNEWRRHRNWKSVLDCDSERRENNESDSANATVQMIFFNDNVDKGRDLEEQLKRWRESVAAAMWRSDSH
ncbi:hypothetical protein ACFX2F_034719 [Malus domestica]